MTDQAWVYKRVGTEFTAHDSVDHSKAEWRATKDGKIITTNTIDGCFSVFKRGRKAPTSTASKSISTAISQNLTSDITTAVRLV